MNRKMTAFMKGPPTFFVFLSPLPGMTSLIFGGPNFVRISDSTGILKKFRDLLLHTALMVPVCHGFGGKVPSYGEWKVGHQGEELYCIYTVSYTHLTLPTKA